ncbi:MAG: LysM peptidoglycan-binding domain-containing protein, partial [Planctomycetota bacterium]|nr:LysM peptidoglycan-binding domain-containing protein [Planctomycetota bacterium]
QNHRRPIQARHQEVTVQIPPRPYRIRDRDTLESIAKRFLGDANRAQELFDQNRGILARPDILPIGQTILIPQ